MKTTLFHLKQRVTLLVSGCLFILSLSVNATTSDGYQSLTQLFEQWREFEQPPLFNGAPDYRSKTFDSRYETFESIRKKLFKIETANWSIENKIDWHILWAELNGYEFNHKLLKPWQRDPAFYKSIWSHRSDVPAHEGPTHHGVTELWTYQFPLSDKEQQRLIADLSRIEPLNQQAKGNLTGNAAELWKAGIRDIHQQTKALIDLQKKVAKTANPKLSSVIKAAIKSTSLFAD